MNFWSSFRRSCLLPRQCSPRPHVHARQLHAPARQAHTLARPAPLAPYTSRRAILPRPTQAGSPAQARMPACGAMHSHSLTSSRAAPSCQRCPAPSRPASLTRVRSLLAVVIASSSCHVKPSVMTLSRTTALASAHCTNQRPPCSAMTLPHHHVRQRSPSSPVSTALARGFELPRCC